MRYESTRGGRTGVSFRTVVLEGLAPDGGLFVPERVDPIDAATLDAWADLSYVDLAAALFRRFVDADEVPDADLRELLSRSYASFDSTNVAPLHEMTGFQVLELFHGPSLSFKDVALQVVGNLFEYFLSRPPRTADEPNPSFLTVVGATSGDTGSAAIYGLRGKKNIQVFILHPKGKVSELQERQMTTVLDDNVHNLAVDGTFDDCQDAVKAMFGDPELRARLNLAAVNSINWARILSQTVYYFWAYFRAGRPRMRFSVPTGNFGDVLAGYYARQLGLPCEGLLVATNANDILHRFFSRGEYHKIGVTATVAPAMDIQVSSNFERFLYHLSGNNAATLTGWMDGFKETGELTLDGALLTKAQATFSSASVSDADAVDAIRRHAAGPSSYVVCPHTACGIVAAERGWLATPSDILTVCLATAHPGKFADVVRSAIAKDVDLPPALAALREMPTRCESVSKDVADIRAIVERVCAQSRPSP